MEYMHEKFTQYLVQNQIEIKTVLLIFNGQMQCAQPISMHALTVSQRCSCSMRHAAFACSLSTLHLPRSDDLII